MQTLLGSSSLISQASPPTRHAPHSTLLGCDWWIERKDGKETKREEQVEEMEEKTGMGYKKRRERKGNKGKEMGRKLEMERKKVKQRVNGKK